MKKLIFILALILFNTIGQSQVTVLQYVSSTSNSNKKFEKFEVEIKLSQQIFTNPYDEDVIDVEVEFVRNVDNQLYTVDAFWFKPYNRCNLCPDPTIIPGNNCSKNDSASDPNYLTPVSTTRPWRARFSPSTSGLWKYRVIVKYNSNQTTTSYKWFYINNSNNKGFIKVANNNKNFQFEDGDIFFPIGMNITMGESTLYNRFQYVFAKNAIEKISNNGGNYVRLWMDPNRFGIEWNETGIGNYDGRQNKMFDLDELIEIANNNSIKIQLCLEAAFQFDQSSYWNNNPYKTLLTSSEDQDEFFTKQICKDYYKQKLRYIISRWGYSTTIFAFEMWNEVDQYKDDGFWQENNHSNIREWHDTMITYAKSKDFNRHLFTTSTASTAAGTFILDLPEIDFIPDHHYSSDYNSQWFGHF